MLRKIKTFIRCLKNFFDTKKQRLKFFTYEADRLCEEPIGMDGIEFICISDMESYKKTVPKQASAAEEKTLSERFNRGSKYCALLQEDECLSDGWVAYQEPFWISEVDTVVDMKDSSCAILYDFFTLPHHRGKGYYPRLLKNIVSHFDKPESFMIYIKQENTASERGIIKAQFKYEQTCNINSIDEYLSKKNFKTKGRRLSLLGFRYNSKL